MKNRLSAVFFILMLSVALPAHAKELLLEEVLVSSNLHYPKIKAALAKKDAAGGKLQEAEGAFDLRLDGDAKLRGSGYYDGDYAGVRLVKPFAALGSEAYVGYRNGRGDFPVYNEELRTRDSGEVNVGVIFSLLRNRDFDERRFKMENAGFETQLAELDVTLTRLTTQMKAQHAYGEWLASGLVLKVYEDLLSLAEERQRNLAARIKEGDEAGIMATENEQNLIKRKTLLNDAKLDFIKKSNNISLFWRDENGDPVMPTAENLPARFVLDTVPSSEQSGEDIMRITTTRPELQAIKVSMSQQRNRVRLGENSLLPKVDLGVEVARDQGDGPTRLDGTEGIAIVKLSVPLQRNLGEGQVSAAKAQLRQLENEQRLISDAIGAELRNLMADIQTTKSNLDLSSQEVKLAETMQQAERQLFANGTSNLFLINTREEKASEARIKNVLANLYLFKALGSYHAATVQYDKLYIQD